MSPLGRKQHAQSPRPCLKAVVFFFFTTWPIKTNTCPQNMLSGELRNGQTWSAPRKDRIQPPNHSQHGFQKLKFRENKAAMGIESVLCWIPVVLSFSEEVSGNSLDSMFFLEIQP